MSRKKPFRDTRKGLVTSDNPGLCKHRRVPETRPYNGVTSSCLAASLKFEREKHLQQLPDLLPQGVHEQQRGLSWRDYD